LPKPGPVNFRKLCLELSVFAVAVAVVGGVVGYVARGTAGLWGALLGAAITWFFCGTTAAVSAWAQHRPIAYMSGGIVVSWVLKMLVALVVLGTVGQMAFLNKYALGITVLVGVLGALTLDVRVVLRARITTGDE
jgi:hypothetical protein